MRIQCFPALNGDCILVEYIQSHFILIDGGYVDTYKNYLAPALNAIEDSGGIIDLLIVTHIDQDHISGIIKLFESERHQIQINNIWYNGYRHIQSVAKISDNPDTVIHKNICKENNDEKNSTISAKQGCTLSTHIKKSGINWNSPTQGAVIKAPLTVVLDKCIIHVLSPNDDRIKDLSLFWKKELIKKGLLLKAHSSDYWDDAFEFSLSMDKPGFHFHTKKVSSHIDLEKIKNTEYVADNSATNGSSISFILEVDGKRVLFLGDSHAETIVDSLIEQYGEENKPIWFDAVKLSHHGSYNNNSPELFKLIDSDKWMILTNGQGYNHPDEPTLANIIGRDREYKRSLFFNYALPVCEKYNHEDLHSEYQYDLIIPSSDGGIDLNI